MIKFGPDPKEDSEYWDSYQGSEAQQNGVSFEEYEEYHSSSDYGLSSDEYPDND